MVISADDIRKVAVIGAGTMGSGIAAQVANAGLNVLLLDVAGEGSERNAASERALVRIGKSDPPLLMRPDAIGNIEIGNIDDDLARVAECDWVVEAIVERLEIKRGLYRHLATQLKDEAVVSSNTSTIPIALLMEDMPASLVTRFCITHFFNPVRYMRLLELVSGADTDPAVLAALGDFCDRMLGKGIVACADTPGFLGNRVGVFAMQAAIHEATELGLDIEEADALFGRPMGIPKTGCFGLYDLIGVDLMADVVRSLRGILPQGDPFHLVGAENPLINRQIAAGYTGNKGKGGFYREIDGRRQALDLTSGKWRPRNPRLPQLAITGERDGLTSLIAGDDRLSVFCWRTLAHILGYAANLVPEVTNSPQDIDDAMKLGYNWLHGPFEMIDIIGSKTLATRMADEGWHVPEFLRHGAGEPFYKVQGGKLCVRHGDGEYHPVKLADGVVRFHMLRRTLEPATANRSASLYHLDDGIRLVEFHTKANALDQPAMKIVAAAAGDPGNGIIVHNDAQHFSAGVNLAGVLDLIDRKDWDGIDQFLIGFQGACAGLCYCDAPVIGTPSGLAIGGGYEVLAHCDKVVAHTNTVMGLVETLVGLVPGGGGVKETYWRWYQRTGDWQKAAWNTFNQIGYGRTGSSPWLSAKLAYFEPNRDEEVMNRDRLVQAALRSIAEMSDGYRPRTRPQLVLAGGQVYAAMVAFLEKGRDKGQFFDHDVTVASAVAAIVTGGAGAAAKIVSEQDMFRFERENFIRLAKTPQTRARIESLLTTGGAVRN